MPASYLSKLLPVPPSPCATYSSAYDVSFDTDTDECSEGMSNCSQVCINTDGSFTCGCNDGYLLDTDGTSCNGMYREHIDCYNLQKYKLYNNLESLKYT